MPKDPQSHRSVLPVWDATVLILGATGAVGSAITRRLLAEGFHVIAQGRDHARLARLQAFGASSVQGDIRLPTTRAGLLKVAEGAVAVISFLPTAPGVVGTGAQLMREMPGASLIHLSSPAIYERTRDQYDLTERDDRPARLRAGPFRTAERIFQTGTQGRTTLIRPGQLHGHPLLVASVLTRIAAGPLPLVRGGQVETSVLSLSELADAMLHLLRTPAAGRVTGPFNLVGARPVPARRFIDELCAQADIVARWRPASQARLRTIRALALGRGRPAPLDMTQLLGWSLVLSSAAFRRETGWAPKPTTSPETPGSTL